MSVWGQAEPFDEITISRRLDPRESSGRQLAAWRAGLVPLLPALLGGLGLLAVLIVGFVVGFGSPILLWTVIGYVICVGMGLAIALPLGASLARSRAAFSVGPSGVLTVTWDVTGVRITSANFSRTAHYGEILRVREVAGFVVLRFRMTDHPSQYLVGLPQDFVPPEALAQIAAAGVRMS